jgi:predicted metal-dependent phosphoesterase TrpH
MLIDMHVHTSEVSPCAKVLANEVVTQYVQAGYDAIVITDHFNDYVVEGFKGDSKQRVDRFLEGYEKAYLEGLKQGLKVFLGIECCLTSGMEDYLLYGVDRNFLYAHPKLYTYTQKQLYTLCKDRGILLYQAHPFRSYCKPQNPDYLDGVEIFNGNPRHDSKNELTKAFAQKYPHLKWVSGSDFHQLGDCGIGGIKVNATISNEKELVQALQKKEIEIVSC